MNYRRQSPPPPPTMGDQVEQRPHRQTRFVVLGYDRLEEYNCAACGAQPDGHYGKTGAPQYTGGVISATVQTEAGVYDFVFACRCHAGDERHERLGLRYFDRASNVVEWRTYPLAIVADRGSGKALPTAVQEYNAKSRAIWDDFRAKRITVDQRDDALRDLTAGLGSTAAPSLATILASDALRALYWPTTAVAAVKTLGHATSWEPDEDAIAKAKDFMARLRSKSDEEATS